MYLRRVNRNRVHLSADLTVDDKGASTASVAAEYTLKQSKLHLSVDSGLLFKSTLDAELSAGVTVQASAEMQHVKEHFRFGYGIVMG